MNDAVQKLDALIDALDSTGRSIAEGDAIDRILGAPSRVTGSRSLRDDEVVQRFRAELSDGLIRTDTLGRLLDIFGQVIGVLMSGR